jgi:hypothetical protein
MWATEDHIIERRRAIDSDFPERRNKCKAPNNKE